VRSLQAASAVAAATVLILFVAHSPFGPGQIERAQQSAPAMESRRLGLPQSDKPAVATRTSPAQPASPSKGLKFGGEPNAPVLAPPSGPQPDGAYIPNKEAGSRAAPARPAQPSSPEVRDEYASEPSAPPAALGAAKEKSEVVDYARRAPAPSAAGYDFSPKPAAAPKDDGRAATQANEEKAAAADGDGLGLDKVTDSYRTVRAKAAPADPALLKARGELSAQLAKTPNDTVTMTKLAEVDERLGRGADALKWRKKLTELCPKEAFRWVDLGRSYEANAQPKNALPAYKKAISLGLTGSLQAEANGRIEKLSESSTSPASSPR